MFTTMLFLFRSNMAAFVGYVCENVTFKEESDRLEVSWKVLKKSFFSETDQKGVDINFN